VIDNETMRTVTYAAKELAVEILTFALPRARGLLSRGAASLGADGSQIALLSPVEIPIGASFTIHNAEEPPLQAQVLGCARNPKGRYLVVGVVQD
jgi:hypothetical protein